MSRDETINPTAAYAPLGYPGAPHGVAAPHATAYYASAQLPATAPPERNRISGHARVVLILIITLAFGALALAALTWLVFGDNGPQFKIQAFSVPYFNVSETNSGLQAKWEANVTAKNPTRKLDLFLGEIEGVLIYRGVPLDSALVNSLHVGAKGEGLMRADFSFPAAIERGGSGDGGNGTSAAVVRQMEDDQKSGTAVFELRMVMEATFTSTGTVWSKRNVIRVVCLNVRVNFPATGGGGGAWNGEGGDCLTYDH